MEVNSQWRLMALGIISTLGLGYYFKKLTGQQQEIKRKISDFKIVYEQSKNYSKKSFSQIMTPNDSKLQLPQKNICIQFTKPYYNNETFKLFQRQRSLYQRQPKYSSWSILQHQMGGQFLIQLKSQKARCKLNDVNLSNLLLTQDKQNVHLFKGINQVQPIVCSVVSTLSPLMPIAIYGKLYFDDNKLSWTIEPYFLTRAFTIKEIVQKYYQEKLDNIILFKFAILFSGIVLSYFTLIKPLKQLWNKRRIPQRQREYENEIEFFKNKQYLIVKGESLLNCQKCKQKSVEIVYECGHLAMCTSCHQNNQTKQCPLCKKHSNKFMKIFMA